MEYQQLNTGSPGPGRLDSSRDPGTWIEALAPTLVGTMPIFVAQNTLKQAMLSAALQQADGNLSRAARLLGVTRQAIQQMLQRYEMRALRRVI
jgi:transcriptional regulator with GAF, ATPase, and Fis domain